MEPSQAEKTKAERAIWILYVCMAVLVALPAVLFFCLR